MDAAPPSKTAWFFSDLHLFSMRSTAGDMLPKFQSLAADSHTMVLGGDIFDFKWSTHGTDEATLDHATAWLDELISSNEACEFHFILGNHDSNPAFVSRLEALSDRHPLFRWHRYFARLDHCLFLHGDVADGSLDHAILDARRERLESKRRRKKIWHTAYNLAIHARLHRLAILSIREIVILRRIQEYANQIGHGLSSGVTDIYFGHTHMDLDGVEYQGLTFHNGGAAIRGLNFRVIETTLERPAKIRA